MPEKPAPPPARETTAVRARHRRVTRRSFIPANAEGQSALIASLSRRAYPSLELFVFSLVCGAIVGLGFLLDSQAVLLLGILVTPLMTPWVGFLLAVLTGSPRFLFETFMALFISVVIVFLGGLLSGFAARLFLPVTLTNVFIHARLWLPELIVLAVGAITLVASFARSEDKPFLPSVIIAYAFYLPVNAGGFGLGSGITGIWPQGIYIFAAHFALASVLGLLTLFVLKLRPSASGVIFSAIALLIFIGTLVVLMGTGIPAAPKIEAAATSAPTTTSTALPSPTQGLTLAPTKATLPSNTPTNAPLATASVTPSASATPNLIVENTATLVATKTAIATQTTAAILPATATMTASAPSATPTPSATNTPSLTPTTTYTPAPLSGIVNANEGGGANLRQTPNGKYIASLDNGILVEILPDSRVVNNVEWLHVFVVLQGRRMEGWLLKSVVKYNN